MTRTLVVLITTVAIGMSAVVAHADPLPSWNDGDAKKRIVEFVGSVTDPASDEYVTPAQRIAVFDNDGTLWAEQPIYFQLAFAIDEVAKMAKEDPSILTTDALRAAASGDMKALLATGEDGLKEVLLASHADISLAEFKTEVASWLENSRHPTKDRRYDELLYQPMLELLSYLRDQDFKTYIVSGGGIQFMRVFAENAYGIPPEQVVGSSLTSTYDVIDGVPTITKGKDLFFNDDKGGKPVGISHHIGRRPIFAGGNSDGDFAMLEWTTAGEGPRFAMIVHHTDAEREWAYDRDSHIGKLERGLDEGPDRGWLIVDMAQDWANVYPDEGY